MADQVLNQTPTYTVSHTFSTDDVTGTFDGLTQGDVQAGDPSVVDFTADPTTTKEGVDLYPVNSEFGYIVTDFDGAVQKDFYDNPEYEEGWVGDLSGEGGEHLGLVVSNTPTDTFKTPAVYGTWLSGLGGNSVKASTEHYTVMQHVLSDQRFPGDPDAIYPLDDNLRLVGGDYDGQYVADVLPLVGDVNGDGAIDIKDVLEPNETEIDVNIAVGNDYSVTMKDDGKLLYRWGNMIKKPNDIRIEVEMPLPDEWSTPDSENDDLLPLFKVTQAELVTRHTITNNPNDQIRPEDFENESAIGQLPTYEILEDGRWVTTDDYYAGDGTLYPAGTVLKDPALAEAVEGTTLDQIGALSEDLEEGYTNAWYTTMDRAPFEALLNEDGTEYITGPRWRLQPDKYGQDLPSVVIPEDPSQEPPVKNGDEKYVVGEDTTTVLNLLDWEFPVSPLSLSAGWQNNAGTVSENGLNMTQNFDVAFYVKGDIKPATLYDTELVMSYEEVDIEERGVGISGAAGDDILAGKGGNTMTGDTAAGDEGDDLFVLSYGVTGNYAEIQSSTITDFQKGEDAIGLIDLSVTDTNFDELVSQSVEGDGLHISLGDFEIATLSGLTSELDLEDFLLINRGQIDTVAGGGDDDYLVGDDGDNILLGETGDDTILGLGGDDQLVGYGGDDSLDGGDGDDLLHGGFGADVLIGGAGIDTATYYLSTSGVTVNLEAGTGAGSRATGDTLSEIENLVGSDHGDTLTGQNGASNRLDGGLGDDLLQGLSGDDELVGGLGADTLDGGDGVDRAVYADSADAVDVDLSTGSGSGGEAEGDTLINVEAATGSMSGDRLIGDTGDNSFLGLAGDDHIEGDSGDDELIGRDGADTLLAGTGDDTLYGGWGDDYLHGAGGDDIIYAHRGNDTLFGGLANDTLYGGDGDDVFLFGGRGSDMIDGGEGDDRAEFEGNQSDYTVVDNGSGSWTVTENSTSQVSTLTSIETIAFDDALIFA